MQHHWIVERMTDNHGEVFFYELVDYIPNPESSRTLAEEIDGKSKTSAVNILKTMYETVATYDHSMRIFCRKPIRADPARKLSANAAGFGRRNKTSS